jgi:catechol 2,3-dioxygenase-like lactoylglutathione lyase family enzyme
MLRGLATINYWTDDMEAATRWYSDMLGVEPYFERAGPDGRLAYAEFRIGDYEDELGLVDRAWAPAGAATEPGGAVMYWHVDDIAATFEKLLSMGAREYQPITPPRRQGVRDGRRCRPVRERAGDHAQPSLPGDAAHVRGWVVETIASADAAKWESWLAVHHAQRDGVWLKIAKKRSRKPRRATSPCATAGSTASASRMTTPISCRSTRRASAGARGRGSTSSAPGADRGWTHARSRPGTRSRRLGRCGEPLKSC